MHLWEIQAVRDVLILASAIGVVYLGYMARIVTVPMLLALTLAYLFEPLIQWSRRRRLLSRRTAVLTILGTVFAASVLLSTLGTGFVLIQSVKAVKAVTDGVTRVQASVAKPEDVELRARVAPGAWMAVRDFVVKADAERIRQARARGEVGVVPDDDHDDMHAMIVLSLAWLQEHGTEFGEQLGRRIAGGGAQAVSAAVTTVTSIATIVFTLFLTAFFFYFFATGWGRVLEFWERLIPESQRVRAIGLVVRMDRVIAGFVRGRVTICVIISVVLTIVYFLSGVPAPLLLGPIVGLLLLVPFVHVIGVPIAMLLMWLDVGSNGGAAGTAAHFDFQRAWWWIVFAPIGIYLLTQVLDDYILTPRIQGKTTDLAMPAILFASLAGGALGGLYGLLLAIPVAACVKILLEELFWPRFRAWAEGRAKDFLPIPGQNENDQASA